MTYRTYGRRRKRKALTARERTEQGIMAAARLAVEKEERRARARKTRDAYELDRNER
ncbi:hypothetical protein RJJ65_16970 [Rhizobium hidalgonense]|uniref:DUF4169 domain-containing protein n=1 Tax=Rhizobium hidalgonense TaxID=1538159 RepID=A0AAJ2GY53_9HYPH|nr:hypothetical protein [Rhizobium hidalgonense]MDR9774326.1 hypothetical protein [Rhizobium hidalgonense]